MKIMRESPIEQSRGILNRKAGEKKFHLARQMAAQDLSFFIEHYWIVSWDLRGLEPYVQETLPYPSVHLVLEKDRSSVIGVQTRKFVRLIEGKGRVFGVKFKPGAFYPFVKTPVAQFTNVSIGFGDIFGIDSQALEEAILSREDEGEMVALAENFLRERLPERDENVRLINEIVDYIITHREITKVDEVASRFGLSKRTLQRLFRQYVGVSPKWVIKRYRLHEVVERLSNGEVVDWPRIVLELGYSDQAHFIKDFKAIVGVTPAEYAKHNER